MAYILQLDAQGQPVKWINWETAVIYYAKNLVSWTLGEDHSIIHGGINRISGNQSVIKPASIIAIKGEPGKKRFRSPPLNNKELFRRDNHTCAYCTNVFTETKLTRDHIIPRFLGGKDTWMNVITACKKCNHKKDSLTLEEANMELAFMPYVPSRAEYLILQNRNILSHQKDFLLSFVDENSRVHKKEHHHAN